MLYKKLKRILNGKAYGWKADGDANPMLPLGVNGYEARGKETSRLFKGSKPIKEEYEIWVKKKGVQAVLSGTASKPKKDYEINSDESVKYIDQWVKNDCKEPLEITVSYKLYSKASLHSLSTHLFIYLNDSWISFL